MAIYNLSYADIKDKLGDAVRVGLAAAGGLPNGTLAPVHADLGVGSVSDPEATDATGNWSISSFIRALFKKATTFENRLTAITRDRAFMEIGGTTGPLALSSDYVVGAVRIHSFSGVSFGLTTIVAGNPVVGPAEPIYIHFVRDGTSTGGSPSLVEAMTANLLTSPNALTGFRDLMPPILIRGTSPPIDGQVATNEMHQFEAKTIGAEYFGQNGLFCPVGFTMIASTRIESIVLPTTTSFFVQCQITGT
jgi:hypothetical protein